MKLLLYCTKAKPYLKKTRHFDKDDDEQYYYIDDTNILESPIFNGKIVAECDFEVEEITLKFDDYEVWIESNIDENVILKQSCLDDAELYNYLGGENGDRGYAIHIKNLHIFDKPRELSDYYSDIQRWVEVKAPVIKQAPQNMMYAFDDNLQPYTLISIKPEWLCKILNGEKTIEVRKKVLKEML